MKHAYLIMAHNEPEILSFLVSLLDDARNDIYIHWDIKSGEKPRLATCHASLNWTQRQVDVRWADFSMVDAEYVLFEEANANGPYAYYHLISGTDLPAKSQDYIHDYCEKHQGQEFIGFANPSQGEIEWRTQHRFIFTKDLRNTSLLKRVLRQVYCKIQDLAHYQRNRNIVVKKGPQWVSVTQDFVAYLLEKKNWVFNHFNHTFCPDEMFIPTLCWNSPFKEKVFSLNDEFGSCKRYIKWVNGELLPIEDSDINNIKQTESWFARKFSSKDAALVNEIKKKING